VPESLCRKSELVPSTAITDEKKHGTESEGPRQGHWIGQARRGWIDEILDTEPDVLVLIIGKLANATKISSSTFKKARISLPSFSDEKWEKFAKLNDLPADPDLLELDEFKTPVYHLPPSFHKTCFEKS